MPGSVPQGKQEIKEFIDRQSDIRTILDIGCGAGTYPKLLGPMYTYIGVEIWKPYGKMWELDKLYKDIIYADFTTIVLPDSDCVIFGDVLEHVEKEKAVDVLRSTLFRFAHVVVSIPVDGRPGKVHYGNPHEAHISTWTYQELKDFYPWAKSFHSKGIGIFLI